MTTPTTWEEVCERIYTQTPFHQDPNTAEAFAKTEFQRYKNQHTFLNGRNIREYLKLSPRAEKPRNFGAQPYKGGRLTGEPFNSAGSDQASDKLTAAKASPKLTCLGRDFPFTIVRRGSARGYVRSPRGPGLAHVMSWYLDPKIKEEVYFTKEGRGYVRFNLETLKIPYCERAT